MVTQDRAQSMYNATICHRSALPCFPYARRSGALAAVAGQTTTAAIKKDEAQERIEAPHSRAGRRLSRTGRVGHRGFHGAGERKRASLKLFCAAPFLGPPRASKRVGGGGSNLGVFLSKHQNNNTKHHLTLRPFTGRSVRGGGAGNYTVSSTVSSDSLDPMRARRGTQDGSRQRRLTASRTASLTDWY